MTLRRYLTTVVGALMMFLLAMAWSSSANAQSLRISCDVYATNTVDPIADAQHIHKQFGNNGTTDQSTWSSLRSTGTSSCPNASYLTSAGWYPEEQNEPTSGAIVYYRSPGDKAEVHALPEGLELVATQEGLGYNCGAEPLSAVEFQATPPYDCTQNWATHLRFPACWNGRGLERSDVSYGLNGSRTNCPTAFPHRLLEVNFTITHKNLDGRVPNPLRVSMGNGEWGPYTNMHADYFFAAQNQVYKNVDLDGDGRVEQYNADNSNGYEPWQPDGDSEKSLVDLCVTDAPTSVAYNNARCRADGLLNAHIRDLRNMYEGKPAPAITPNRFSNPPSAPQPYPVPSDVNPTPPPPAVAFLTGLLDIFGFGDEHDNHKH